MEKLSNTEAALKKSVPYKKACSQQQQRDKVTYESFLAWKILIWTTSQTISPPKSLPESDITYKISKTAPFGFLTLRLLTYQIIVRLFRFQLLILMVWYCLNRYVYSDGSISFGATKVTGITKSSGKLFCHGKFVNVVEVNVILNRFGPWMKKLCGGVVLVRHNFRAFDEKHF